MGIVRLLLALSVVALHTGPILGLTMVGGRVAVQAFYMMSGFYMALVLSGKYRGRGAFRLFMTNRMLKLYPIYWVVLIATIALGAVAYFALGEDFLLRKWLDSPSYITASDLALFALSNVLLVSQDLLFLVGIDPSGSFFFEPDYTDSAWPLHHYLFVGQAWTLSLELMFYAIAPFLNRLRTSWLGFLIAASLAARALAFAYGYRGQPWDYQFFPFELALFLVGMVLYRAYAARESLFQGATVGWGVLGGALGLTFLYQLTPGGEYAAWGYLVLFACAMPFIFGLSRNWRVDRQVGELSYPVYICHILVGVVVAFVIGQESAFFGLICAGVSIGVAYLLNLAVMRPIEAVRRQRVARRAQPAATVA